MGEKHGRYVEEALMMNPEDKVGVNALVRNFMGVLLSLRFEGRNFNLQANRFLDGIQKLIDP